MTTYADHTDMSELTTHELTDPKVLLALSRRTDPVGVLSVYVDAEPGPDPRSGAQAAAIDIKNRLNELQRRVEAEGPAEQARAVAAGIAKLSTEIDRLTRFRESGRGRALFASLSDGRVISRFAGQLPLPNRVVLDTGPFIHPLLELLDEGRPTGVLLVSREAVRVLEWRVGELDELERLEREDVEHPHERSGPVGSRHGAAPGSPEQDQHQDWIREQEKRFLEGAGELVARQAAERGWQRLLVSGEDRLIDRLAAGLSPQLRDAIVRDGRSLAQHDHGTLTRTVTEKLLAQRREEEARLIAQAREAALGNGKGAVGLSEVTAALNEGRVLHLIYDPEVRYRGAIDAEGGLHPDGEGPEGAALTPEPRLTERLVERALETGARVTPVEQASAGALREAQGIAALLRW
jgi:protein required for attachment to host cells